MARRSLEGVRVHVILTKPQDKDLRAMSESTGIGVSELVRRAIDDFLTKFRK